MRLQLGEKLLVCRLSSSVREYQLDDCVFCLHLCHNLLQAVPPDTLDGRTVKRHPSGSARHPLHLFTSLPGVLGGLAGVQDSMDSKSLKMCPFQAIISVQSGTHQVQGEG